jgi:hypothetical protein
VIPLPVPANGINAPVKPPSVKSPQANTATSNLPTSADDLFRPARRFIPNLRLLGLIQEIISNGGSYRISLPGFQDVLIWPHAALFQCEADITVMPEIFRRPWSEFNLAVVKKQPPLEFIDTSHPLILLRYLAALHGSEGRLMLGVNAQAKLRLKALPDIDLLGCTPEQQRLAMHLHDYPASLGELATATETVISDVIDFTNACREIGLIEEVHQPPETTSSNNPRRGLLHHLRRGWQRLHQKQKDTQ